MKVKIAVCLLSLFGAGTSGADVRCVQSRLDALGFSPGAADGVVGPRTLSAAAKYAATENTDLPEFSEATSAQWCSELAKKTAGMPGFEIDKGPGIDLFAYSGKAHCRKVEPIGAAPSSPVIDRKRAKLVEALHWFNGALSSVKAKPEQANDFAAELATLSGKNAFVRLDWSGSGSSPAHWQTNLLKNIAFAVNIIDHFEAWQAGQRASVVRWGNKVYANSHYTRWGRKQSHRWPDTIATAAAAYIAWGVVAPNPKALKEGQRDFDKVARLLRKKGGTGSFYGNGRYLKNMPSDWGARLEDKMLGDLVIAAHSAKRADIDLFNRAPSGVSLYTAIVGWQDTLFSDDPADIRGNDLSFLTTDGQERSWSWTEYFVYNYPDDQRTKVLREKSESIRRSNYYGYKGLATGPSSCLLQ